MMQKFIYFVVIFSCVTISIISATAAAERPMMFGGDGDIVSGSAHTAVFISSTTETYRHLASILMKRKSSKAAAAIPNNPQLLTSIVAQIKARIHTEITSKISASVKQICSCSTTTVIHFKRNTISFQQFM
jgi:hypothetical protein